MKCEEFMERLDALIDGELDEASVREMQLHAQECEKCGEELRLANILRETLDGMDDDIVPPLAAQAAWRSAVKAEARRRKMRGIYKVCSSVAAALVLVVGCVAGINAFKGDTVDPNLPATAAMTETVYVAADGDMVSPTAAGGARTAMQDETVVSGISATVKMQADDPMGACDAITALASEYNGITDSADGSETSAYITAYIPSESVDEFISSLELAGVVASSEIEGEDNGTATITITIKKE